MYSLAMAEGVADGLKDLVGHYKYDTSADGQTAEISDDGFLVFPADRYTIQLSNDPINFPAKDGWFMFLVSDKIPMYMKEASSGKLNIHFQNSVCKLTFGMLQNVCPTWELTKKA